MPRPSRKKQKTAHIQRSCNSVLVDQNQRQQPNKPEAKKLVLFGKSIIIDEHDQQVSFYQKLRFWFRHAIPEGSKDTAVPRMSSVASPSTSRQTHQEHDVPLGDDSCIFQKLPRPLATNVTPYPTAVPLKGSATLPAAVINDPKCLLKHHKAHWKTVRKDWIHHRQMYLQRYKPCFEFINSTYLPPLED
ncbi:uncharacterized protein LOC128715234 [Anopheles marshallii]|uniref:uncharacterized protein LOC128715234 n=1 Tax=Anopheles marshallii TaxID=1521116 RepID=UPI00237A9483|nr:uncharacterized protein LOC128715234 [Anopheles marshallii]